MGGVLHITAEPPVTWLPQSRVFAAALSALADEARADPELSARLATAADDGRAYADLRALEPDRFGALPGAAARAVAAELARGPARASDQRRLRYGMSLLRALLASDPRAGTPAGDAALTVREGVVWRAPAVTVQLAREHLAAAAGGDASALDLRAARALAPLLDACDWMVARYAPRANLEADADAVLEALHPPLAALAERLRDDPRARLTGTD
jgi:hypothetical protein